MQDQKVDNLLNLALDATPQEREKSLQLNVGYDEEDSTWEVIVKYTGDLRRILGGKCGHCGAFKWICHTYCTGETDGYAGRPGRN